MWATYGGHGAAVDLLLAAGANVNTQANPVAVFALRVQVLVACLTGAFFRQSRATALITAAVGGHAAITLALIDAKADLNLQSAVRSASLLLLGHVISSFEVQLSSWETRLCPSQPSMATLAS
jgi:ankyrin repeat protein